VQQCELAHRRDRKSRWALPELLTEPRARREQLHVASVHVLEGCNEENCSAAGQGLWGGALRTSHNGSALSVSARPVAQGQAASVRWRAFHFSSCSSTELVPH